ncbi:MAG: hypothetical protein IPQ08_06225 [Chitinophagaceae bacterium]|nr:hypothetical protein [Chitinophagaceae bacterium]
MSAIKDVALFLYGFDVSFNVNRYINFKNASLGPELTATLNVGNYTATEYMAAIKAAMELVDGVNTYTVTLNRSINGNTENRMTISTSGSFLSILFGTGTSAANSPATLIGFISTDHVGFTSYTGTFSSGTILIPSLMPYTYNYLGPENFTMKDGVKNISSSGIKETLVFADQRFFEGEWKYIANFGISTELTQWQALVDYMTRQLSFEFTRSINENPNLYEQCTLEKTPQDSNGMGHQFKQMMGEGLYRFYTTGPLTFRVKPI